MSGALDLTMLSGTMLEISRDLRLMRLQMDNLASRLAGHDGRFGSIDGRLGGIDGRLGTLEQSFHELANETGRGFGQVQQQLTRHEKRFDAFDAGLAALHDSAARMERALADIVARLPAPVISLE
jgi:hypothetical protein